MSIYFSICSISWSYTCSYDYSPCFLWVSYLDDLITYLGTISSTCACLFSCCSCSSCTYFSLLHNSCSSLSCYFNSYNSFSASSNFFFALYLCTILLPHCHLLASISKATLNTSESTLNFQIFSASTLSTTFLLPLSHTGLLPSAVVDDASLWDVATFYFANHSTAVLINSLSLEKWYQYLHGSSSGQWHAPWIQGCCTLTRWSFTKQFRSYELKLLVLKVNLLNSSVSASTCLRFWISYNLIHNERAGQGAFFFVCSLADNTIETWYDTSCMTSLSMANFGKTCEAFSALYI